MILALPKAWIEIHAAAANTASLVMQTNASIRCSNNDNHATLINLTVKVNTEGESDAFYLISGTASNPQFTFTAVIFISLKTMNGNFFRCLGGTYTFTDCVFSNICLSSSSRGIFFINANSHFVLNNCLFSSTSSSPSSPIVFLGNQTNTSTTSSFSIVNSLFKDFNNNIGALKFYGKGQVSLFRNNSFDNCCATSNGGGAIYWFIYIFIFLSYSNYFFYFYLILFLGILLILEV
jgi:hypothetical protein